MHRICLSAWILSTCLSCSLNAQQTGTARISAAALIAQFDRQYGTDHNLVNGFNFIARRNIRTGHPFFGEDRFYSASIVVRGNRYDDVDLKFDILEQELILNTTGIAGTGNLIRLHSDFISTFSLEGTRFRRMDIGNQGPRFYQVIEASGLQCLIFHSKNIQEQYWMAQLWFTISEAKRNLFLQIDGTIHPVKNARSFSKIFPEMHQKAIRKHIRSNSIRLNIATDQDIGALLSYCAELLEGGS